MLANQFNPVWAHLTNMQREIASKGETLVRDVSDRSHQLKQQWLNPDAQQTTYLCTLENILNTVNDRLTSTRACEKILDVEPNRFVPSSEFCVRYSGKRLSVPKLEIFSKMESFRSSLISLQNDLEKKMVDSEK